MIWTRVWETYSQKGKPWLCQSQNPTLIAIRSAKMTVKEASWRGILLLRWLPRCWVWALPSSWGAQWVLLFLALYFGDFFFSPCVFGGLFCNCLTYLSFWSWTLLWGSPFEDWFAIARIIILGGFFFSFYPQGKGKSQLSLSLLPWPAVPVKRWNRSFRSGWSPLAVLCPRLWLSMINCKKKWTSYPGSWTVEVRRERSWRLEPWGGEDLSPVRLRVQPSGRMCLDMHWALASVPSTKKQKRREHSLIKFLGV